MTAGTAEKVWRLLDKRVTPAAGAVLTYLAYRAHYEDGRCAWPSVETIAECCFISVKTVQRSIALLIELGYVRENPNQQWNQLNPETGEWKRKGYRTVVYDVLTEHMTTVRTPREERARDRAAMSEVAAGPEDDGGVGQNVAPDGSLEIQGNHDADRMSPLMDGSGQNVRESGQNVALLTSDKQLPPTPTGYPPASGESPDSEDSGSDSGDSESATVGTAGSEPTGDDLLADACTVCSRLESARRAVGLSADPGSRRDLRAVVGLLSRLRDSGVAEPVALVGLIVDWTASHRFWSRRIRSGRGLASHFDELMDERRIDERAAVPDSATGMAPVSDSHRHSFACVHTLTVLGVDRAGVDTDPRLLELACALAVRLNDGLEPAAALDAARDDLRGRRERRRREREERERADAELRRVREANGGSMMAAVRCR